MAGCGWEPSVTNPCCTFRGKMFLLNDGLNGWPASFATQTVTSGGVAVLGSGVSAARNSSIFLCPRRPCRTGCGKSSRAELLVDCGSNSEMLDSFTSIRESGTFMRGPQEFRLWEAPSAMDPAPAMSTTSLGKSGSVTLRATLLSSTELGLPFTPGMMGLTWVTLRSFAAVGSTSGWAVTLGSCFSATDGSGDYELRTASRWVRSPASSRQPMAGCG